MSCCSCPLSRIELRHFSSYLLKTSVLFLIIMFIALKSCVLNHISLNFWYTVFWVHTSEAHGQKAAVTELETKFSIHTQDYVKNTRVTKAIGYFCEGKHLGNKLHDYFRSVWQQHTVNKSLNALLLCLFWGWDSKLFCARLCSQNFHHGIRTATPLSLAKSKWPRSWWKCAD